MSAAAWEGPLAPNHDSNGAFNGTIDPSAMDFNPSPDFDFGQMSNASIPQHMQNGIQRNGSPATYQTPTYQTTSVVPSKRPHADTISNSPRQASRSLTPQQPHFPQGFPSNANGQPTSNGFQNFNQVNSTTASPSPVMPNQQFNVNGAHPPRVATVSPSPFSPAATNAGLQMSPAPSDFSNHGDAGQNGVPNFPQGNPYMNGHGVGSPSFNSPSNPMMQQQGPMGGHTVPGSSNMPPEEHQRRMQMMRNAAMARHQAGAVGAGGMQMPPGAPGAPRPGMQPGMMPLPPQLQPQYQQQISVLQHQLCYPVNPRDQFIPTVAAFNQQQGKGFNNQPYIVGRQFHPLNLWILVMQNGGSNAVTQKGLWPHVATKLQIIPPTQQGQDPQQAKMAVTATIDYWKQNFSFFESRKLMEFQQKKNSLVQRLQQQAAQLQAQQGGHPRPMQGPVPGMQGPQNPAMMHMRRSSVIDPNQPQMSPQMFSSQAGAFPQGPMQRPGTQGSMTATTPTQPQMRMQGTPAKRAVSTSMPDGVTPPVSQGVVRGNDSSNLPKDPFEPSLFWSYRYSQGDKAELEHHGLVALGDKTMNDTAKKLVTYRPDHPNLYLPIGETLVDHERRNPPPSTQTMGTIDIHSLNMALKSGIGAEIRVALDTIAQLSLVFEDLWGRNPLPLQDCDDLLESLMECAQAQLDLLEEHSEEVSTDIDLAPYEEIMRLARDENLNLLDIPAPGTQEYELDMAVDRLLCIMQILQNFAVADDNQKVTAQLYALTWTKNLTDFFTAPYVIETVSKAIKAIGTRSLLLRTHQNTLDFYKDAIMFLSNIASNLDLSGRDETLCILQFLNAFGPAPDMQHDDSTFDITFYEQDPLHHRYLRFAVDALAKLLARDANRTYFRAVLSTEPPYELLTRTFGLAISTVPTLEPSTALARREVNVETNYNLRVLQWRQAYLKQGLLAADLLAGVLPAGSATLARAWLCSLDGWTTKVVNLAREICFGAFDGLNRDLCFPLVARCLNVLQTLTERARDEENDKVANVRLTKRQSSLANSEILREAYEAWGQPRPDEHPMDRARIRRILAQVESLVDLDI